MNENKNLITLYLEKTLDILINSADDDGDERIPWDTRAKIIKYVSNQSLLDYIPFLVTELATLTGLLESYDFDIIGIDGVFSPVAVNDLPTDTQGITLDFENVKYLVERLGKDEFYSKWLSSIHDWVEAVSDFQYANKNTGEVFNEYINRLSSIFVRKVLSILAIKYGFMAFDKDVIEIIEKLNKPNLINMKKIKSTPTREKWGENHKGLAEVLRTQTSPLDATLITCAGDLFPRGDYQANDASIITKSVYCLLVAQTIEFSNGEFQVASKDFSVGSVYISMEMSEDNIREKLIAKGKLVYKVILALIGFWINNPPDNGHKLKVSGTTMLKYLGHLYPHDSKGTRLTKEIGLNGLAEALQILVKLRIATSIIESQTKTKRTWRVDRSALFEIYTRSKEQENLKTSLEVTPITDIDIFYNPGEWFKYLHTQDRNYHNNIGHVHKEALRSNEYYGQLLLWLTHELEYHPGGDFKVRTILSGSGYLELVESLLADYDRNKALTLFNTFSTALEKIKALDSPYPFYYRNLPTWLRLNLKKPTGWFRKWLEVVVVFEKPECLRKIEVEEKTNKPKNPLVIDVTAKKVEDTSPNNPNNLEALEARIKESGVSKRAISLYLNQSHNWLSRKLNQGNWTKKDYTNIYNAISFLSKKK